ncbi:MAG TPA: hypothetical protein VGK67_20000 [Myxococcales bacterium]
MTGLESGRVAYAQRVANEHGSEANSVLVVLGASWAKERRLDGLAC